MASVKAGSQFESRLNYRRASTSALRGDSSRKLLYTSPNFKNSIEMPRSNLSLSNNDQDDGNIIIINKE
jgi:hypothetical protein